MKNLTKTILVFFSLFFYTSSSNAEVTYSCWNCMMLGIDGEGNLEGARVAKSLTRGGFWRRYVLQEVSE